MDRKGYKGDGNRTSWKKKIERVECESETIGYETPLGN